MGLSFTLDDKGLLPQRHESRRPLLVTGAAGKIGSYFAQHSHDKYDLRLHVRGDEQRIEQIRAFGEVVTADLSDLPRLKEICRGMDTVLHLAASANPSTAWDELLRNNMIGTYNVLVAAKSAGCRRVVFASSIHAVSGYPPDVQVKTSDPVNPGDVYGVSKCFGESMGRYMAEQEGLSVIAIRIGAFHPVENAQKPGGIVMTDMFVSDRDLNQLLHRCIDVENVRWAIFHGVSDNRFKRLDITDARELLGYAPQDDITQLQPELQPLNLRKRLKSASHRDGDQQSGIRNDL